MSGHDVFLAGPVTWQKISLIQTFYITVILFSGIRLLQNQNSKIGPKLSKTRTLPCFLSILFKNKSTTVNFKKNWSSQPTWSVFSQVCCSNSRPQGYQLFVNENVQNITKPAKSWQNWQLLRFQSYQKNMIIIF